MVNFGWEAQILPEPSDWSNIEKVRKKFIMKTFPILLRFRLKMSSPAKVHHTKVQSELPYEGLPFRMNIKIRDLLLTFRGNYSAKVEDPHIYTTACARRLCRCADFLPWCSSCCGM